MGTALTTIEDFGRKREMLARYIRGWKKELNEADLPAQIRKQLEADIGLLVSIDEDLLRFQRTQVAPEPYDRQENESVRDEIVNYLLESGEPVPAAQLARAFGVSEIHLRNLMRAARKSGRVAIVVGGFQAAPRPDDLQGRTAGRRGARLPS